MMVGAIVSNTVWTFWDVFFLLLFFVPLLCLWFYAVADVFRRRNMVGWEKAVWLLLIILLPYIGVILYFLLGHLEEETAYNPR